MIIFGVERHQGFRTPGRREAVWAEDDWTGWRGADLRPTRRRGLVILGPPRAWPLTSGAREAAASGLVTGEEWGDRDQPRPAPGPTNLPNMPKDYFEAPEVEEEFLTEEEKHVKVIEFVYQVDSSILDSFSWVQIILAIVEIVECRSVCERLIE